MFKVARELSLSLCAAYAAKHIPATTGETLKRKHLEEKKNCREVNNNHASDCD